MAYADGWKGADGLNDGVGRSLVEQGFDASPIPKNKLQFSGKDRALVGLGAYLVNAAGDCSGCHSFPRFLPKGDTAGSDPAFGDPYSGVPSHQLVSGPCLANYNINHSLPDGTCFGRFMPPTIMHAKSVLPLVL